MYYFQSFEGEKLHIYENEIVFISSIDNSKLIKTCFLVFFMHTILYNVTDISKKKMCIFVSRLLSIYCD